MIHVVDKNHFNERVRNASGMVLVNFWTSWSDECRNMYPLMLNVADILDDQDAIVYIDWDRQKRLAQKLEVFGVPTLLIYINGREKARYSGTMNKVDLIERIIEAKNPEAR